MDFYRYWFILTINVFDRWDCNRYWLMSDQHRSKEFNIDHWCIVANVHNSTYFNRKSIKKHKWKLSLKMFIKNKYFIYNKKLSTDTFQGSFKSLNDNFITKKIDIFWQTFLSINLSYRLEKIYLDLFSRSILNLESKSYLNR